MRQIVLDDGVKLSISESALERIRNYLTTAGFKHESGGVILGGQSGTGLEFVVADMTLPDSLDDHGPYHYVRRAKPAEKLIRDAWEKTDGAINYLGEWHTHNEQKPHPSYVDRNLMVQVSNENACLFDRAFMIIVGYEGTAFIGEVNPREQEVFCSKAYAKILDL